MLQQTRVEAVKSYYTRFLEELPDIKALAEVPEDRLLKLWEGLGYYNRARNLKAAAQQVMINKRADRTGCITANSLQLFYLFKCIREYTIIFFHHLLC